MIKQLSIKDLKEMDIDIGKKVIADDIAKLSGQNKVKGIHPIERDNFKCTVILCTINGENYRNEWLDHDKFRLKYYLEGKKDPKSGKKIFNKHYKSNQSIINSKKENYPILVFCRNAKGQKFEFEGEYCFKKIEESSKCNQYFILVKRSKNEVSQLIDQGRLDSEGKVTKEGKLIVKLHKIRERDGNIKKEAIAHAKKLFGEITCVICGFNFEKRYGERGKDFIEAHHNIPLSQLGDEGGETRIEDISLVCSNCHRMIHHKLPWLTIEQMKEIVK